LRAFHGRRKTPPGRLQLRPDATAGYVAIAEKLALLAENRIDVVFGDDRAREAVNRLSFVNSGDRVTRVL